MIIMQSLDSAIKACVSRKLMLFDGCSLWNVQLKQHRWEVTKQTVSYQQNVFSHTCTAQASVTWQFYWIKTYVSYLIEAKWNTLI